MISLIKKIASSVFFPPLCLSCQAHLEKEEEQKILICVKCIKKLKTRSGFVCSKCDKRIPKTVKLGNKSRCCNQIVLIASGYYEGVLRDIIFSLKYKKLTSAKSSLKYIIKSHLNKNTKDALKKFIIIPIPLYSSKERERGFNQARLISEILSEIAGTNILLNNLVRIKDTKPQVDMKSHKERGENIQNAFIVTNKESIKGKNIILVDDVFTSGSTMREAVSTLKKTGAKKIVGFVVAKA